MLLIFILLNPAPEIIYQVQHDSPLDVFKHAYEFVLENWIEWFFPWASCCYLSSRRRTGLTSFFLLSRPGGEGSRLGFLTDPDCSLHDSWELVVLARRRP